MNYRIALKTALLLILALLFTWSCARKQTSTRDVWAEADGKPIFRDQVERYYRARMAESTDGASPEQVLSVKLSILNQLINNQILLDHASHAQIAVSEAEVDRKLAQLQTPYAKEEFQKKLSDQGLSLDDLRREVRENLTIDKLVNKEIASRVTVTDAEIANYYDRNKGNFNVPERQYHLAQIEVTPFPDPSVRNLKSDDAKNAAEAQRKIEMLYTRLRRGEDFATIAQEYSEDPKTASGGGDMGFIPQSSIDSNPQLKQLVSSLKVGETSGIIHTPRGFHIFKMLGQEEPGQHPASDPEVQSAIRQTLMNEKEELLKAAYVEDLRNRAKVVNYLAEKIVANAESPK